jgi:hypothetical protein
MHYLIGMAAHLPDSVLLFAPLWAAERGFLRLDQRGEVNDSRPQDDSHGKRRPDAPDAMMPPSRPRPHAAPPCAPLWLDDRFEATCARRFTHFP